MFNLALYIGLAASNFHTGLLKFGLNPMVGYIKVLGLKVTFNITSARLQLLVQSPVVSVLQTS